MKKIISKAYEVDLDRILDGFLYDSIIGYGETRDKAKYALFRYVKDCYDMRLSYSKDEVTYLNLPIKRCKRADKYEFEGNILTSVEIYRLLKKRERFKDLDSVLNNDLITHCYIRKGGYYYRPNSCGYSEYKFLAGVYDKDYAVSHAKSCDEIDIIPIDIIKHNEMINKEILELSDRLIK